MLILISKKKIDLETYLHPSRALYEIFTSKKKETYNIELTLELAQF